MKNADSLNIYFRQLTTSVISSLPKREFDWQTALLTILLTQLAITRLVLTEWSDTIRTVESVGLIAVLLGFVIGYSNFKRLAVFLAMLEYGLIFIPLQLFKDIELSGEMLVDIGDLITRLGNGLVLFINNLPGYDDVFFTALYSVIFWIIGVQAGYALTRHGSFLRIVLPSGIAMLVVQLYDAGSPLRLWALAFYAFFALALLGRMYFNQNTAMWKNERVFSTPDAGLEIWRSVLALGGVLAFAAWALPGALTRAESAAQAWEDFSRPFTDRFSNSFSMLDSPYNASGGGRPEFFGSSLGLGLNAPTSDDAALVVQVTSLNGRAPARYYWRGRTYDRYINGQWASGSVSQEEYAAESERLSVPNITSRIETTITVTMSFEQQRLLYAPAEVAWLDVDSQFTLAPSNALERDMVAISAAQNLAEGEIYEVISLIANPSVEELRAAGNEYPQWVLDRYLQVPSDIEPQLKELAENIAGDLDNPYDQAQAITDYLRNEIGYVTEMTETPVNGEDPVLWVLFDYKKGFCMYSASADVMLLRSIGIPARMAVGFAQGQYDAQTNVYLVERRDAHAWAEVYFPEIGWVEFEPTGNQTALARPAVSAAALDSENGGDVPAESDAGIPAVAEQPIASEPFIEEANVSEPSTVMSNIFNKILWSLAAIGFIAVVFWLNRRYALVDRLPLYLESRYHISGSQAPNWISRWAGWAGLSQVERAFHAVNMGLVWMKQSAPFYATAKERAKLLSALLPSAKDSIKILEDGLEASLFANRAADITRVRRAGYKVLVEAWRERKVSVRDALRQRIL